eukprot:XP_011522433.1 uncharacterized protein LOC105369205 isoform X3 [Homo sapiens]
MGGLSSHGEVFPAFQETETPGGPAQASEPSPERQVLPHFLSPQNPSGSPCNCGICSSWRASRVPHEAFLEHHLGVSGATFSELGPGGQRGPQEPSNLREGTHKETLGPATPRALKGTGAVRSRCGRPHPCLQAAGSLILECPSKPVKTTSQEDKRESVSQIQRGFGQRARGEALTQSQNQEFSRAWDLSSPGMGWTAWRAEGNPCPSLLTHCGDRPHARWQGGWVTVKVPFT